MGAGAAPCRRDAAWCRRRSYALRQAPRRLPRAGPDGPIRRGHARRAADDWVAFLPCCLWIFLDEPFIERLRGNCALSAALSAIAAGVFGVTRDLASGWGCMSGSSGSTRSSNDCCSTCRLTSLDLVAPHPLGRRHGSLVPLPYRRSADTARCSGRGSAVANSSRTRGGRRVSSMVVSVLAK
jgi:hypothetical protein